jgi:hypothetical protein
VRSFCKAVAAIAAATTKNVPAIAMRNLGRMEFERLGRRGVFILFFGAVEGWANLRSRNFKN